MGRASRHLWGPSDIRTALLLASGAVTGAWGLWAGINRAPIEAELKMTQKIFYFHAPLGIWTIVASIAGAVAAIDYLVRRREKSDLLSDALMEVGTVACGVVLITGCLWARPAWGDWFPWGEPRVTGMLVVFLLGLAYRAMRSSVDDPDRRARFSAVVAILGAIVASFAYAAIHIWNTTHPRVISTSGIALQADMKRAFFICVAAMGLLVGALVQARYRLAVLAARVEQDDHDIQDLAEGTA